MKASWKLHGRDVGCGAEPFGNVAVRIEQRHRARERPAEIAPDQSHAMLHLEGGFRSDRLVDRRHDPIAVFRVEVFLTRCRISRQSGLMRYTTSAVALTSARKRASLACSSAVDSLRTLASLRLLSTRANSSRAENGLTR
jgi:hypothetical protein